MNQSFDLKSFDKHSKGDWIKAVSSELNGADPEVELSWSHVRELQVKPMYHPEDLEGVSLPIDVRPDNNWLNLCPIHDQAELSTELISHCNGMVIDMTRGDGVWKILAKGPSSKYLQLRGTEPETLERLSSVLSLESAGSLGIDLLDQYKNSKNLEAVLKRVTDHGGSNFPNFKIITIPGDRFVDQGADVVLELALTAAQLTAYYQHLISSGVDPNQVVSCISWGTSIGQGFFHEVAKLRAFRNIVALVQESFGLPQRDITVFAQTSPRYKTGLAQTNNLIRDTVEATAAVVGGCAALSVVPSDHSLKSKLTALDVANLLREESYFNRVVDPAAGSYFIEQLTNQIGEKSWSCFQAIDREGGYVNAVQSGWVEQQYLLRREWMEEQMQTGGIRQVNVNHYQLQDPDVAPLSFDQSVYRLAASIEKEVKS